MDFKQADYLKAVWKITQRLQSQDQFENALSASLETIVETMDCEEGSVWMTDFDDGRLYAMMNVGETDITGYSLDLGQGIAGQTALSGISEIVEDCSGDPRFSNAIDSETGFITRSLICAPLKNAYGTIGCIQIVNKKGGKLFNNEDLSLCEALCSLVAIAIEDKGFKYESKKKKEPLMRLKGLVKDFPSGDSIQRVLKGINLDIYKNEFLVILGESGCGKSTLLNIIGGMDELTEGEFYVENTDFSHPTEKELTEYRRNYLGFIFQSYNLMPNLTALENVQYVAEISKNPKSAEGMIELVGLKDRADSFPSQMSGGQQQRVSIARALVKNPRIILADEPTAALDFATSREVLKVIEDVVKAKTATVIMVTHNAEIAKMADRVIKLKDGRIHNIRVNLHPLSAEELSW